MKDSLKNGVVRGVLAIDLRIADSRRKRTLDATDAQALAAAIRRHLIAECAEVRALRLCLGAAFYAPNALLRIGWPLHRRLMASAKAATHATDHERDTIVAVVEDGLPQPEGCLAAHELMCLPYVLEGPASATNTVTRQLDRKRMLSYTPIARTPAFDLPALPAFDAVGYLSLRALSSVLSGHYYALGLGDAWTLIERAIFDPATEHRVEKRSDAALYPSDATSSDAPWLHYVDGRVRIAGNDAHAQRCRTLLETHGLAIGDTVDGGIRHGVA
jgi:hypothetical protein